MSSGISASGLITGIDSETMITQILAIDRQPITRMQTQIAKLESQRTALSNINSQLSTLRTKAQAFTLNKVFQSFETTSSEEDIVTATTSGSSPVLGSFKINVSKLATASVAKSSDRIGSTIDTDVPLVDSKMNSMVTGGEFTINGVTFDIDTSTDSMDSILAEINASAAGVTATYNSSTDKITFANTTAGNNAIINFGAQDDTSNFLSSINVTGATQSSNGDGSTTVTSSRNLGAINTGDILNDANLGGGAVTAGVFSINGISISVDPTTDSLSDIIVRINNSDAGVTASYDATSDGLRLQSKNLGSRAIAVGGAGDTSNFLSITNMSSPTQTVGQDSEFTIDGGPTITRNTNTVTDALGGVNLNLITTGESTITIASDSDPIVSAIKDFIDEYNNTIQAISDSTATGAALQGDSSVRTVANYLKSTIFSTVSGARSPYLSLIDVGFNTGDTFDPTSEQIMQLNEEDFLEAYRKDPESIKELFTNNDDTGILDIFDTYLKDVTSTNGSINSRVKSSGAIDEQIDSLNDRIDSMNDRLSQKETRLRKIYANLEVSSAKLKAQSASLSALSASISAF